MSNITLKGVKPASKEIDKLSTTPNYTLMCQKCPCNIFLWAIPTLNPPGNVYALTVICMLIVYTFCIPIKIETASDIVQAYIDNVYSKFGGFTHILSDNVTELKTDVAE